MQALALTASAHRPPLSTSVERQINNLREMGMNGADSGKMKMACHQILKRPDAENESTIVALLEVAIALQSEGKPDAAEAIYSQIDQATGNAEAHQRYESIINIRRNLHDSFEAVMPMLEKAADQEDRPMAAFFCAQALIKNETRTHQDVEKAVRYFEKALKEGHPSAKEALTKAREELSSMMVLARTTPNNAVQNQMPLLSEQTLQGAVNLVTKNLFGFFSDSLKKK